MNLAVQEALGGEEEHGYLQRFVGIADGLIQFCLTDRARTHLRQEDRFMLPKLFPKSWSGGKCNCLPCDEGQWSTGSFENESRGEHL